MELSEDQRKAVKDWIENGLNPGDVQKRIKEDFEITLTYLELRMLMDDIKAVPKAEPEEEAPETPETSEPTISGPPSAEDPLPAANDPLGANSSVRVTMDQITRPNSLVSGKVTFSDGQAAEWHLDTTGRLGLNPSTPGYRPSQEDVMAFQMELQRLAQSQGL